MALYRTLFHEKSFADKTYEISFRTDFVIAIIVIIQFQYVNHARLLNLRYINVILIYKKKI